MKTKKKKIAAKEDALPQSQSLDSLRDQVTAAVQAAACSCNPNSQFCQCADDAVGCDCDDCYVWVRDLFPDKVVYSIAGKLYQRSYSRDAQDNVALSAPIQVEVAYTPLGESYRAVCGYVSNLKEAGASYNAKTGELTLTVIKPGLNTSKSRFYPASVLKRDASIFENAKMFADHQTDKEAKDRPEGSVNNWVAQLGKPWAEADGTIRAKAKVIDPPFKEKLESLQTAGLLSEMGVSIRAIGVGAEAEVADGSETVKTNMIERLVAARSVDFVTYPGAGGRCEVLESDRSDEFDVDLLTVQQLKERRPDLLELIESNAREEVAKVKTLEQQLQESEAARVAAVQKAADAETKLTEATNQAKKAETATKLSDLLKEAKLPAKAEERLKKQFENATEVTGMKEAIDYEKEYIASLAPGATVRNMGAKDNGIVDTQEADETKAGEALKKSFLATGMSEAEAKIAAGL
jgi:hypothetical protein